MMPAKHQAGSSRFGAPPIGNLVGPFKVGQGGGERLVGASRIGDSLGDVVGALFHPSTSKKRALLPRKASQRARGTRARLSTRDFEIAR